MTERHIDLAVDEKHLGQFAENTVRMQKLIGKKGARPVVRRSLVKLKKIRDCFEKATAFCSNKKRIHGELEWLLDNWYLAEREGKEAVSVLRQARKLPYIDATEQVPAVLDLAGALVRSGQNELSPSRIELFLHSAQKIRVLSEQELSLFVSMLKIALIDGIALLCDELEEVMAGIKRGGEDNPFHAEVAVHRAREAGTVPTDQQLTYAQKARERHEQLSFLIGNAFTSLRMLSSANLTDILEGASRVEEALGHDPAGVYANMDEKSRGWYRREICQLAKKHKTTEYDAAMRALGLSEQGRGRARHVGYYIFTCPLGKAPKKRTGAFYVGSIVLITLFITLMMGFLLQNPWATLLLLVPVSEIVKNTVDFIVVRLTNPRPVVRMKLEDGVPKEGRTLCVISTLLSGKEKGAIYAGLLEQYRLANRDAGDNLCFGILADLPDSDSPPGEEQMEYLARARTEIERLNQKYDGGYFLLYREPTFNEKDKRYMGWERKRGALVELMRLLRRGETGLTVLAGNPEELQDIKYVITLDSDTRLNAGAARELIGAMLHPLNRPEADPVRKIIVKGYGLLQPRISVELAAANRSQFSRIFAGQGGIDPYGSTTSDVYHDLFDEGTFTGKGIIDVDSFYFCLNSRFPENTVLSHDLLEGAYLHAGLIGDIELTDSYPYKVTSYFVRLHRWIRGDWQASRWLARRVINAEGKREPNPLSSISKWKLFDNLRRSMTPVLTFLALLLGMLFSGRVFAVTAGVAVLCAASYLLLSGAELAFRRGAGLRVRYHSTIIAGFGGVILQTLLQLLILPYQAYISTSAIVTALYRMFVSKRYLLAWITADAAEKSAGSGIGTFYRKMGVAVILGSIAILASLYPAGSAVGALWALSPAFSWLLSREEKPKKKLGSADRAFLLHEATLIWRYFCDFMTAENHFLPPDNYQEQPAAGLARRTSPTNMGMALLCALAAADLSLFPKDKALDLIGKTLSTMERLPKWNGHLHNWYDTRTLQSLHPCCVSTVDSGNLCGCLIALREGLMEMGGEAAAELAERADALAAGMKFSVLYDKHRRLFSIGYDVDRERPMDGWYDLMASEARQTSYIAVARGEVEPRHWRRLGRALVNDNDYRGMASWTGTMFEYLMPNLLMPCYKNSLLYESASFCVYVQKRRTAGKRIPWGISESAFYAFDGGLNYQYKAHGVQKLGFKRGLNRELVISPYSSFLAMQVAPASAVRNLRNLRSMGMEGKYGMYEAVDFTPGRQVIAGRYEIVRSYMAHHIGMSMLAIDNILSENIMQRRFMRDRSMAAFDELLQEKVPVGAVIIKSASREVPERVRRTTGQGWTRNTKGYDAWLPRCMLLSNGSYTVFATDTGMTSSTCGDVDLTRFESRQKDGAMGMQFYVNCEDGFFSLTPAPLFDKTIEYSAAMDSSCVKIGAKGGRFTASVETHVPENENCELREVKLVNNSESELTGEMVCYFEPVLAPRRDYEAHPAFSKLALDTAIRENGVIIHRRAWGNQEERFMVFLCDAEAVCFDTSREKALGRGGEHRIRESLDRPPQGTCGSVLDPCVLARIPIKLKADGRMQVRFALSYAGSVEDAENAAQFVLKLPKNKPLGRMDGAIRMLKMSPEEATGSMEILCNLVFITRNRIRLSDYLSKNGWGQQGLWQYGISGDLPLLVTRIDIIEQCERAIGLTKQYRLLTINGGRFDFVILLKDGGDYRRPLRNAVLEGLKAIGCERLLGNRGGIHLIDNSSPEVEQMICGSCAMLVDLNASDENETQRDTAPLQRTPRPIMSRAKDKQTVEWEYLPDGSVRFFAAGSLPEPCWSHTLANGRFGYTATDAGVGHMWYRNARENKITPWHNDLLALEGGERITLRSAGQEMSLFADRDGQECTVTYGLGFARWEKSMESTCVKTTIFVPPEIPARVCIFEAGEEKELEIGYFAELLLGPDRQMQPFVTTRAEKGEITAQNRYNTDFGNQTLLFLSSDGLDKFTCDAESWSRGVLDGRTGAGLNSCIGAVIPLRGKLILVTGCAESEEERSRIRALANPAAAGEALERTIEYWKKITRAVTVKTPDESMNRYLNGWALYQTMVCRVLGRSSTYQCGGAYGFRDQLQDVCGLIGAAPELAREQILLCCAHQFEEGDVQHWWHPGSSGGNENKGEKGVRTRITDDLLWLPYTVCDYVEKTGDSSVLQAEVPFIASAPLRQEDRERYEAPDISQQTATVYNHCIRAVEQVLLRGTGEHGLALIGGGDWNDGFDKVGIDGRGESTWLTWFLIHVLERFSGICERLGQNERSVRYQKEAETLVRAANAAWDGEWFVRGYYDNGDTLGSAKDAECRIDSIAQSFAAMVTHSDKARVKQGMQSAVRLLMDEENQLVKLFTPAFGEGEKNPGYIKGYLAGVRENGGQYTHAAIWLAMGCFWCGLPETGTKILSMLLPAKHDLQIYKVEPYVLSADVYSNPDHLGRGGWTWYTGAAAWYYRVAVEILLGLKLRNGVLFIKPNLPQDWNGFEAVWRTGGAEFAIEVSRGKDKGILIDGKVPDEEGICPENFIGNHRIEVVI